LKDAFNLKDQKKWIHHFISSNKYDCLWAGSSIH